ncbi:MAG: HlyD family type I secretion periplasmic adaptor subunit [Halioglobus sp.]
MTDPGRSDVAHHQREFLPAALEILETPPSPTGRVFLWSLTALFCLGLLWSCLGEIDIVVTANGRIVPTGQVKTVQAPETASVATIHVTEGSRVSAGDRLITFDTTYANADETRTARQIAHHRLQLHWRNAITRWLTSEHAAQDRLSPLHDVTRSQFETAAATYQRFRSEVSARLQSLARDLDATTAEQQSLQHEEERARAALAILDQRVEMYRALVEQEYGARLQYLELLQQQSDLRASVPILRARQTQLAQAAAATQARLTATREQIHRENLMALAEIETELENLRQDARKSGQRKQLLQVTAPVSGTVQELAIHTTGAVVTAAQPLLNIVPDQTTVEVEGLLKNQDIGFVHEGQRAEVKVQAFNFTKYGLLEAKVLDIGDDAIQDENLGWAYKVRLSLENITLQAEGKQVSISPGMTITAEIMTGKRRLIEFFLSPLLRVRQESLRQR